MLYTKELFIEKCNIKHNNKYDYSKVIFNTVTDKIIIGCKHHGDFIQEARTHKNGAGCIKCMVDSYTLTKEQFLEKANLKHNNTFNYDKTIYTKGDDKIIITCSVHRRF